MYDSIVVVGNGKTSRENIEALIDDYLYANPKVRIVLYSADKLSDGQIWLKQYLEYKGTSHEVALRSMPKVEGSTAMFLLWAEDDVESNNLLSVANEYNWPAFDLTNGLHQINSANPPVATPKVVEDSTIEEELPEYTLEEFMALPDANVINSYSPTLEEAISNLVSAILNEIKK